MGCLGLLNQTCDNLYSRGAPQRIPPNAILVGTSTAHNPPPPATNLRRYPVAQPRTVTTELRFPCKLQMVLCGNCFYLHRRNASRSASVTASAPSPQQPFRHPFFWQPFFSAYSAWTRVVPYPDGSRSIVLVCFHSVGMHRPSISAE